LYLNKKWELGKILARHLLSFLSRKRHDISQTVLSAPLAKPSATSAYFSYPSSIMVAMITWPVVGIRLKPVDAFVTACVI
jgi:hypothetical protein